MFFIKSFINFIKNIQVRTVQLILFAYALGVQVVISQNRTELASPESKRVEKVAVLLQKEGIYSIDGQYGFNAFSLRYNHVQSIEDISIVVGLDTFNLSRDEHVEPAENGYVSTKLIMLDTLHTSMQIIHGGFMDTIYVFLINSTLKGDKALRQGRVEGIEQNCEEPASIDQSIWREGLTAPSYTRAFTNVTHLIIHHSAGANDAPNYYEVVRAIYLYHTEINGWSDIGYNYLIAPDGTLFKGRDPDTGSQDDVRGAHFCGYNSNTMGVCMMGTYTTIAPTDTALQTLEKLLTWKALKDGINPLGVSTHTLGSIPNIAGHRDGCATECPGQMTYNLLGQLRTSVSEQINICNLPPPQLPPFSIYPNPIVGTSTLYIDREEEPFEYVKIISIQGELVAKYHIPTDQLSIEINLSNFSPGVYIVQLSANNYNRIRKIAYLP